MAQKMKIWTVLVGVKLQPDQHPKTPVIHKVGGYGSGSDISRGLYALADIWNGGHARPASFSGTVIATACQPVRSQPSGPADHAHVYCHWRCCILGSQI